jgi:hypothetical protein
MAGKGMQVGNSANSSFWLRTKMIGAAHEEARKLMLPLKNG